MKLTKIYTSWTTFGGCVKPMLRVTDHLPTDPDSYGIEEHAVDVDVTEPGKAEAVQAAVNALRAEQGKHQAEITRIEDRIQRLLCIEHKEGVE